MLGAKLLTAGGNRFFVSGQYTGASSPIITGFSPALVLLHESLASGSQSIPTIHRQDNQFFQVPSAIAEASVSNTLTFNSAGFNPGSANNFNQSTLVYSYAAWRQAIGFMQIVSWTGNGGNLNLGHSLGVVPSMIWVKRTDTNGAFWRIYHSQAGNQYASTFNSEAGLDTSITWWNNTSPTSTQFSVGTASDVNNNGSPMIAMLFADLPGVQKADFYIGNGSSSGPSVNCGLSPRFILLKRRDSTGPWSVFSQARGGSKYFAMGSNQAEQTLSSAITFTSTGFTIGNSDGLINANGEVYIYLAVA